MQPLSFNMLLYITFFFPVKSTASTRSDMHLHSLFAICHKHREEGADVELRAIHVQQGLQDEGKGLQV